MSDPLHTVAESPDAATRTLPTTGTAAYSGTGTTCPADLPEVPGYRVLHEIARGGMGRVLAAVDLSLGREVALKVLLPGSAADRFVRESKIAACLPHPGIPPVHALGTLADGSPFLAMKLIAGQTLAEEIKTADRPRLVQAFEQICQAVGFAHARGIIHRDLKPANVMVGAFGEVQVMDWGLAKDLARGDGEVAGDRTVAAHPDATQAGAVMGTPSYMAPEQARGEVVDARADVFALGGILCAILTEQPTFGGRTSAEVILRAASADLAEAFARLDACGADAELVALCRRCLSASAAERPADGKAVADAVAAYRAGVETRLRQAERDRAAAEARAAEQTKRRRVQLALSAALGLLLVSVGAFAWWRSEQARATSERLDRNAAALSALAVACEDALQIGNAVRAAARLTEAELRLEDGGGDDLRARLHDLRIDLTVLQELLAIDQYRWTPLGRRYPRADQVATRIRAAFVRFGVPVEELAARIASSVLRARLVVALDRWLDGERAAEVHAVLQATDPDPYRDAVRAALLAGNRAEIAALASRPEALAQPVGFTLFLGEHHAVPLGRARQLLASARQRQPGDLAVLMALGLTYPLNARTSADERVRWFQAAVEVAPTNPCAHHSLGVALRDRGDPAGAVTELREALRLDPEFPHSHNSLGNALGDMNEWHEAAKAFRAAIRLLPGDAYPHNGLGNALRYLGDPGGAVAEYQEAIRLDRTYAMPHTGLGDTLALQGDGDGAIRAYETAGRLDPQETRAHNGLGIVLERRGDLVGALAAYDRAVRIAPENSYSQRNLRRAELWRALLPRLPDLVAGRAEPKTPAEACDFARLCGQPFVKRYVAAVRLYEKAFAADARLADDLATGHRYSAVCYAVLAASDSGSEADNVTPAALREKALAWLRADLRLHQKQLAAGNRNAAGYLGHWLRDGDLTAARPGAPRDGWSPAEAAAWDDFWNDVRAARADALRRGADAAEDE